MKSATTLMTIMNDMLHSPQLSAHIHSSQAQYLRLADSSCRPRAYTAPPTPLAEFPPAMDPVELPGSLPEDSKGCLVQDPSQAFTSEPIAPNFGEKIVRAHSSPQEASWPLIPRRGRMSVHSYYRDAALIQSCHQSPQTNHPENGDRLLPSYVAYEAKSQQHGAISDTPSKQISLAALPLEIPQIPRFSTTLPPSQIDVSMNVETQLLGQISKIRATHYAHMGSLRETHQREIDSHQSYISFLESRQKLHVDDQTSSYGDDAETVQRELSLCRRAQVQLAEMHWQMDELRDSVQRSDQKIIRLQDVINKSRESEKALKNSVTSLEARLVTANNERTDVLEGFNEACAKLHNLARRERLLDQEVQDLRRRLKTNPSTMETRLPSGLPNTSRLRHKRTLSDVGVSAGTWPPLSRSRLGKDVYEQDLNKVFGSVNHVEPGGYLGPPIVDKESPSSLRSRDRAGSHAQQISGSIEPSKAVVDMPEPGLGISLLDSSTDRTTPFLDHVQTAQIAATPPPRSSTMSSPPAVRSKTPLGTHKKLPKPPHLARAARSPPMTPPRNKAQRSEAFRSFSESMVPSRARDGSYECRLAAQNPSYDHTPPLLDATRIPMSKFALRPIMVPCAGDQSS